MPDFYRHSEIQEIKKEACTSSLYVINTVIL